MMSDPTKVYGGGIPMGGYNAEMSNAGFGVSGEAESNYVAGKADAASPKVVKQGGATEGKTYDKSASEDFLMSSSYKTSMEIGRPGATDVDNPDDISHADHCDDEDIASKY